jgi:hypothetical protein
VRAASLRRLCVCQVFPAIKLDIFVQNEQTREHSLIKARLAGECFEANSFPQLCFVVLPLCFQLLVLSGHSMPTYYGPCFDRASVIGHAGSNPTLSPIYNLGWPVPAHRNSRRLAGPSPAKTQKSFVDRTMDQAREPDLPSRRRSSAIEAGRSGPTAMRRSSEPSLPVS